MKRLRRSGPTAHRQVEQIDPGFAPRLAADVGVVYLDNQAVLFDGRTGDTHLLNPSGAIIVSSYDGVTTLQAIITDIAAEVGVSEQVIGDDVLAVTRGLGAAGVLDGVLGAPRVAPGTGLEPNTPLPQFAAVTDSGDQIDAWQPAAGVRTLLVNWSLSCGFCAVIAPALGQLSEGDDIDVVLVTKAAPSDVAVQLSSFGVGEVPVLSVSDLPLFFRGVGTPAAYLVSPDGRVESPIAVGANSVGPLIDELLS